MPIRITTTTVLLAITSQLLGQQVELRVSPPPYYVGEPVVLRLYATGFDETPQPQCRIAKVPAGLNAQLAGISPNISRSIQIINGRRFDSTTVQFRVTYQIRADHPGQYTLGPFVVTQNGKQAQAKPVTMTFTDLEEDPNMRVRLVLPTKPVFLGERVPIRVELWLSGSPTVRSLNIYSPIFDRFSFVDPPGSRNAVLVPIQTAKGTVQLPATRRVETADGRRFDVFSAERILVPDEAGEFSFPPIRATMRRALARTRPRDLFDDVFGNPFGSRQEQTVPSRAVGKPVRLVVKPLPVDGRPASFAGAVGPGYTIDVEADRTVVRAGDPITLNVTLHGQGNLGDAGLPPLSADGGLDPGKFRLPEGDVAGTVQDGQKRFSVTVRVTDPSVSEIPALAYSWFDPADQAYHTARSKPIALRVTEAKVVSAADVVRAPQTGPTGSPSVNGSEASAQRKPASGSGAPASGKPAFTLSGADLAVQSDPSLVLADARRRFGGTAVQAALYGIGLLAIAFALWDRKRRDVAPEIVQRRRMLRKLRADIDRARECPVREGAEQIAAALRGMLAEVPNASRDQLQSVLAQCETIVYAPSGVPGDTIDPALVQLAASVADEMMKEAE